MDTEQNKQGKQKLYGIHYRAIELRYQGKKYAEISEILTTEYGRRHADSKIRQWFMRGGMLEDEYLDYCHKENERRRAFVMEEIKTIIDIIPGKLRGVLERKATNPFTGEVITDQKGNPIDKLDAVTLQALKLLIEMLGFKTEKQPGEGGNDPIEEWLHRAQESGLKLESKDSNAE